MNLLFERVLSELKAIAKSKFVNLHSRSSHSTPLQNSFSLSTLFLQVLKSIFGLQAFILKVRYLYLLKNKIKNLILD